MAMSELVQGLVTVIVPAFNRRDLVGETLESVRLQTYPNIQLLVVDDGSRDGTADVAKRWIESSGMVDAQIIRLTSNVGKCRAVNLAMERARGEYLMILDSDDVLTTDCFLREIVFLASHPACGMVYSRAFVLRDGRRTMETIGGFEGKGQIEDVVAFHGDLLFNGNVVISSSALIRTALSREVGGLNPDLRHAHDWDYWIRISGLSRIGFIEGPLVYYRVASSGALSANRLRLLEETHRLLSGKKASVSLPVYRRALMREFKEALRLTYYGGDGWQCIRIAWYAAAHILPDFFRGPGR
jgi:glycosyltransferase involved in cell wall biosynthesis